MLFLRDIDVDVHVRCLACGHGGALPRSMLERRFGPNYPVLSIAPHYRCSRCHSRDTESRPAPLERFPVNDGSEPAAEPSFDAPLAALQGLLASVRGPNVAEHKAPLPPWRGGGEEAGDHANLAELDDTLPAFKPFVSDAPAPSWQAADPLPVHASGKSWRPLEELVADGPADEDADPLWEPVSLADMAARRGELTDDPPESFQADSFEDDTGDAPHDETLAAMRRLFAEADLGEEDGAASDAFFDEAEEEESVPAVFSHKALVRSDFDEDPDDFGGDPVGGDAGFSEDSGEDEPTDEEILNFAIRDPEKPAPAAPQAERTTRPSAAEEEDGFDKTLAALRSMIEDAATEPIAVPPRRKERPAADPLSDTGDARAVDPPARPSAKPAAAKAGSKAAKAAKSEGAKRSAQEREIEEAMKAMRDMVDEDEALLPEHGERAAPKAARDDPAAEAPPRPGKVRAVADGEASPLSKTIAALRGMLEIDGRRKR